MCRAQRIRRRQLRELLRIVLAVTLVYAAVILIAVFAE